MKDENKKSSRIKTGDLSSVQKTRLFDLGFAPEEKDASGEDKANELLELLATPLPLDPATTLHMPELIQRLCQELRSVAGEPLGQLLRDPNTKISALQKVKDYAKELGSNAGSEIEHDTTLAIYYAAIASALIYHQLKITDYSYSELEKSFSLLRTHSWIPSELDTLYAKALQCCSDCR